MYCKISEQVIKKRISDEKYIEHLEHCIYNIASRLNVFVAEFERDIKEEDGKNLKELYKTYKACLTDF